MKNSITISFKLIALTITCLIVVLLASCIQPNTFAPINVNLVSSQAFDVSTRVTGQTTNTRGTIFVTADPKHPKVRHVEIIAWVQVDPADDDGVTYILPTEWDVTAVATDFAKNNSHQNSYIAIYESSGIPRYITVGKNVVGFPPLNGGQGNIKIDLELKDAKTPLPDNLVFNVAAGNSDLLEYHIPFNSPAASTTIPTVTGTSK
jgi:hypothetical protein